MTAKGCVQGVPAHSSSHIDEALAQLANASVAAVVEVISQCSSQGGQETHVPSGNPKTPYLLDELSGRIKWIQPSGGCPTGAAASDVPAQKVYTASHT